MILIKFYWSGHRLGVPVADFTKITHFLISLSNVECEMCPEFSGHEIL